MSVRWLAILCVSVVCGCERHSVEGSQDVAAVDRTAADVHIRGDCTIMGMRIVGLNVAPQRFTIVTTGARLEYDAGELRIHQGLAEPRRLLATMKISGRPAFEVVEQNYDHVLLRSPTVNLGVYGDSTLIAAPKADLTWECRGSFKPAYEGRYKGELLLIDDAGGIEIFPQRREAGYRLARLELGRESWRADYELQPKQRMMIAAFPGRPFDWEKSFRRHLVTTYGGMGRGAGNVYGQLPSQREVRQLAEYFDVIYVSFEGLYRRPSPLAEYPSPSGPYVIANEGEFRRFVRDAQAVGLAVAPYTSAYYFYYRTRDLDAYVEQVAALRERYGISGVFVDGLLFGKIDDAIASWETIRRLRAIFGAEGIIVYHGTSRETPDTLAVATKPNIDTYCDVTLYGEAVKCSTAEDPYVRFQVRKYGISNTVGIWYSAHLSDLPFKERIRAILAMNCRKRWGSYVALHEAPPNDRYTWNTELDSGYRYYRARLRELEEAYRAGRLSKLAGGAEP
jgi:hypothetical protein